VAIIVNSLTLGAMVGLLLGLVAEQGEVAEQTGDWIASIMGSVSDPFPLLGWMAAAGRVAVVPVVVFLSSSFLLDQGGGMAPTSIAQGVSPELIAGDAVRQMAQVEGMSSGLFVSHMRELVIDSLPSSAILSTGLSLAVAIVCVLRAWKLYRDFGGTRVGPL
jgi:hypothetical protein